ncbi:AI-2E family transporter [Luteimonas sp. MC1572]|uniref:AI-2E family transporter n=1 Tax=Luteimonas sp. MC1572 TaxID=2799325 RepID=UPI0018F0D689|nr:AI-2E family transporter [Luteimonas sp. MC1572]MBJ6981585.1 AI-2E family transporter [Luteimonas sp. MC1572]QQO02883.1 AI-2E family transporter [Luteimonas sp. MC1572]
MSEEPTPVTKVPVPASAPAPAPAAAGVADAAPARRPPASLAVLVLATLAIGYTLWVAQDVILPVLLAMFFALIGNPVIRALRRLYLPRSLAALLVLAGGLAAAGLLGQQLLAPAIDWMQEAPKQMRQLGGELRDLAKPVHEANRVAEDIARLAGGEGAGGRRPEVIRTQEDDPYAIFNKAPKAVASVLAVVLLTFFFMVFGEDLQRRAIALLPTRQRQRVTVEIMQSVEREISRYVFTISLINAAVGLLLAAILHFALGVGMQEALLWGTLAMLLNFAPYVGPMIGIVAMLVMGFVTWKEVGPSLLPAAIYLGLHTLEGQILTPLVLGQRMRLSPLVLILALMVFGALWGIIGLLLAVPLLACAKLVVSRIDGLEGWARLLE